MKKNSKILLVTRLLVVFIVPIILLKNSYTIDSILVSRDKRPIFVIPVTSYKDGGTTIYQGINYQVIKWNFNVIMHQPDGEALYGKERGYEISKYPNYKDVNDGPGKKLKFIN